MLGGRDGSGRQIKYIAQLNEATRAAEARLDKQEKVIKTQMNDLFLKLQQDFAEQSRSAAQLMQDKEDAWRAREQDLRDQLDAAERRSAAEKEGLEREFNAKLKEARAGRAAAVPSRGCELFVAVPAALVCVWGGDALAACTNHRSD